MDLPVAPDESYPEDFATLIPACRTLVRTVAGLLLAPVILAASGAPVFAQGASRDTTRRDSTRAAVDSLRPAADSALALRLLGRLEFKGERNRNDRCFSNQLVSLTFRCASQLTPQIDFQFSLLSGGSIGERVHVNVDYDSQREFDGSNNLSISYEGKPGDLFQRVEVGNVTFAMPPSRFLTSGIPSGNLGLQATGQLGAIRYSAIVAQQKGNVVRGQVFNVGARTSQSQDVDIPDYRVEPRRFFFTVDPQLFGAAYPNIDLLDPRQTASLAASLPDTLRPARLFLYRLIIGGQPPNPNGPRFALLGDPESRAGQVYELLREGVDYYLDPSLLWFALVRPLNLSNERLVAAWTLNIGGRDTTIARLGGTPDLEFTFDHPQYAHLLWDPNVTPDDAAFRQEIRSAYRVGGEDVRRHTVSVRIVAGSGADQEKAPGTAQTYLELFGLAQRSNRAAFDADNRLWPRPNDPNFRIGAAGAVDPAQLIRDVFVIFPSLEPFSRRGLARPQGVVPNDTIYRTPGEYLYSVQHPQSYYTLKTQYETEGGAGTGVIALAAVQIRQGSERLTMDGRPLVRGIDYEIDYDLGRVRLLTADTLSLRPRRVVVQYEENPLFASLPTSIAGVRTEWSVPFGTMAFTALSQRQRSNFTRPALGYEAQGAVVAGLSASLDWSLASLTRGLARMLPGADSTAPSRLEVRAELAVSRPRQSGSQQAYIESFEGDGGISVNLQDARWQYSSQPALGTRLAQRVGAATLDTSRAATMAFQNYGIDVGGKAVTFNIQQVDPQTTLAGGSIASFEQMLWLTLYPLSVGGLFDPVTSQYRWRYPRAPSGRRWRSVRTALGPGGSGVDLSRAEHLEFWALVEMTPTRRGTNPTLVFDFGDVSENSIVFAPETLLVRSADSTWLGKALQGFDRLDSERDRFSRAFSADANDVGLPGDVVERLDVIEKGIEFLTTNIPTCRIGTGRLLHLGDARIDCTVRNSRLDEEDIDQDNVLNLSSAQREQERLRRFIVDLSDSSTYNRVGKCDVALIDVNRSHAAGGRLCWVQVRLPFNAPDEQVTGGPLLRRVRALRVTMVSGAQAADGQFTQLPLARLRVVGATWIKRAARPLRGLGGEEQVLGGFVIPSVIGTADRDSSRGLNYEPPPGVSDQPELQGNPIGVAGTIINEHSMRILAGGLPRYARAEAFVRFPEGDRNVMSYRELRLWARGRGRGWGPSADLEFFVKIGRDANNFYAFHMPLASGPTRAAWEPEVRVRFSQFYALRAQVQTNYMNRDTRWTGCTGVDSALIAASGAPPAGQTARFAACSGGYVVYTVDPVATPPNLRAVQELAAGIVRVDSLRGADPPSASDTLEVWVDDIRLAGAVQDVGYATHVSALLVAGDAGSLRFSAMRQDPAFRQAGERPSFLTNDDLEIAGTWRLEKLFPRSFGLAAPLTVTHVASAAGPEFLSGSDVLGAGVAGLRSPERSTTTVSLALRRSTPLAGTWFAPLLNNLGLTATWNGTGSRSEFENGRRRGLDLGLDYLFAGAPAVPILRDADATDAGGSDGSRFGGILPAGLTFAPSMVRVTSSYVRDTDTRDAFLKPALAVDDTAYQTRAEVRYLRNATSLEFKPTPSVTARWDVATLNDLRDYGAATPAAIAAAQGREGLVGLDLGLERERNLQATLLYAPAASAEQWWRPRVELASSYSMLRDPNAPVLENTPTPKLSRRFGNLQRATAGAVLDVSRAAALRWEEGSILRRVASAVGPIDVSVSRDQLSSFDASTAAPSWRYQLGVGDVDYFRTLGGSLAASAGAGTQFAAANTITLPFGATISQRMQRIDSRHWSRRLADRQTLIDGQQIIYPDVTVRWSGRPLFLGDLFSNVAASARALYTRQAFLSPSDLVGGASESRATRTRAYPASFNAVSASGNFSLNASWTRAERIDSLPGSVGESRSAETSADVTRSFPLPRSWQLRTGLRARLGYQRTETQSYVSNVAAAGFRSRLTDNGRRAFTLSADTDVAENMTFSLQGSRVVTFDRNFNRRFTQTVLSAVLNIEFFGGALR